MVFVVLDQIVDKVDLSISWVVGVGHQGRSNNGLAEAI
ncbi:Unknown protein sequence [Pseudomonas amygdali pv. lachrymans]|uniref:RNase H type-1 domain-containing protein n=1 Tax=Pseudomonas amygdali pv. lachrymans TaxID=53707 RepID=A0ABR5KRC2_PSEAV|nr:Unknown protein sequence [Pseudomonas amygdali pv. lachrymans]KPC18220.1 Unknown protein sequence [Pseudomonas amygdali pv. lachrymans]